MTHTAGERALYADQANRNENGKVVCEKVRRLMRKLSHHGVLCMHGTTLMNAGGQEAVGGYDGRQLHVCQDGPPQCAGIFSALLERTQNCGGLEPQP